MGKGEEELSRAANLWFGRDASVLICQTPVKGRQLCVSEEVMGYLGESQNRSTSHPLARAGAAKQKTASVGQDVQRVGTLGFGSPLLPVPPRRQSRLGFPGMRSVLGSIQEHEKVVLVRILRTLEVETEGSEVQGRP